MAAKYDIKISNPLRRDYQAESLEFTGAQVTHYDRDSRTLYFNHKAQNYTIALGESDRLVLVQTDT